MQKPSANLGRVARRSGIILLVPIVILTSAAGWLLNGASALFHALVVFFGLRRVEDWLKRAPIWVPFVFVIAMVGLSLWFKIYELHLIAHKHFIEAISLGLLFKVLYFGTMNYILHLFGAQFLSIRWIAWCYGHYASLRKRMLAWLHDVAVYRGAVAIKRRVVAWMKVTKRRSALNVARRFTCGKKGE